jgi:hypothetical protein
MKHQDGKAVPASPGFRQHHESWFGGLHLGQQPGHASDRAQKSKRDTKTAMLYVTHPETSPPAATKPQTIHVYALYLRSDRNVEAKSLASAEFDSAVCIS